MFPPILLTANHQWAADSRSGRRQPDRHQIRNLVVSSLTASLRRRIWRQSLAAQFIDLYQTIERCTAGTLATNWRNEGFSAPLIKPIMMRVKPLKYVINDLESAGLAAGTVSSNHVSVAMYRYSSAILQLSAAAVDIMTYQRQENRHSWIPDNQRLLHGHCDT